MSSPTVPDPQVPVAADDNKKSEEEGGEVNAGEADEILNEENKSILSHIISQLKWGVDLSKVTLPTFLLEPRSLLEKLTDFNLHPELLVQATLCDEPGERMVQIVRWYMSGFHHRPAGVKKPYNPVLGETHEASWDVKGAGTFFYIAEQVSHHPPVSAVHCHNEQLGIRIDGHYYPKSKFLMNSAASIGEGTLFLTLEKFNETYTCTWPTVYCRGIIFGTLLMEMGGTVTIACKETGATASINFQTRGFFGKVYNLITGTIKTKSGNYTLAGKWNERMTVTNDKTKEARVLFDCKDYGATPGGALMQPNVPATSEEYSSRNLWKGLTEAILGKDMEKATAVKNAVEERQRAIRKEREAKGEAWAPTYFVSHPLNKSTWLFRRPEAKASPTAQPPQEAQEPALGREAEAEAVA